MAKIIIHTDQNETEELLLTEGTVTIGRTKDNDIQIDDPAVSAYHAKLVSFFKPTYIQDLRSTNGTYVNNIPVKQKEIKHGDAIKICGYEYRVYDDQSNVGTQTEYALPYE